MRSPQWLVDAGASPELWNPKDSFNTAWHVVDDGCWVSSHGLGYAHFRVPDSLAPEIIKLIEDRVAKPPKKGEGAKIASELLVSLGPVEAAQLLSQWAESGKPVSEYEMVAGAMKAYTRLFKHDLSAIFGEKSKPLERGSNWIAQVRGEEEVTA